MKKFLSVVFLLPLLLLPSACARPYDYTKHLSEVRSDVFRAETEAFVLTLSCLTREHPYASDTVVCPLTRLMEAVIVSKDKSVTEYTLRIDGTDWGGETSYRTVEDDCYYSESTDVFPENSVSIHVEWAGGAVDVAATSVKNEHTMSAEEALEIAVGQEEELIARNTANGEFCGEFRVRLLRRDANYYYVGIVTKEGVLSLLLGAESGEVLARRENG